MTLTHIENHTVPNHNSVHVNGIDAQKMPTSPHFKRSESDHGNMSAKGCCLQPVKYISLTEKIQKRIENNDRWYSLEFFPPRTPSGAVNLLGW
jgi:methylenetetrahydrofolate reductase (NADPH)